MSSPRHRSRQLAVMLLFAKDFDANQDPKIIIDEVFSSAEKEQLGDFGRALISGVFERLLDIDSKMKPALENWRMERLNSVDRAILRLGTYEILYSVDVPPKVAIDEGVELARLFGTAESPRFINGVLDRVLRDSGKTIGEES